jgi:hypothetical protein
MIESRTSTTALFLRASSLVLKQLLHFPHVLMGFPADILPEFVPQAGSVAKATVNEDFERLPMDLSLQFHLGFKAVTIVHTPIVQQLDWPFPQ